MVTVHHLNNSRSQRILWLLEELGTPYEIKKYQRMEGLPLAPPELKAVHPLGKSPVITDGGKTIAESGAIIEYLIDKYGNGRLKPKPGTDDYWKYVEWMHYAEGSAMLPLLLALYAARASYATSMALMAATVFVLAIVATALGRERKGIAFGRISGS